MLQLKKFPDIPVSTREEAREFRQDPEEPCFRLLVREEESFPCVVGKDSRRSRPSQEEALSTGKARGTPGSCHHSQSPPYVSVMTAKLPGGNHKIAPSISPKKSWEGLIGGFLLSLAVGWLFYRYAAYNRLVWYLTASALLSLGCFFGDLAESAVKRLCNIKDSGNWVPGMGGAFDVLDSFIFNGIILFYEMYLCVCCTLKEMRWFCWNRSLNI